MAVLITGGTKGIGFAIARGLARRSENLFLDYRSGGEAAERVVFELGPQTSAIQVDVGTPSGAKALIDAAAQRTERLDLIVHGAIGAGKALAESLMRYLVPELAPLGVRINTVVPGTLDTEAVRNLFGAEMGAFLASEAAGNPSERNIDHEDYVGLVEFLVGPQAQMIEGQVIFASGG